MTLSLFLRIYFSVGLIVLALAAYGFHRMKKLGLCSIMPGFVTILLWPLVLAHMAFKWWEARRAMKRLLNFFSKPIAGSVEFKNSPEVGSTIRVENLGDEPIEIRATRGWDGAEPGKDKSVLISVEKGDPGKVAVRIEDFGCEDETPAVYIKDGRKNIH